MKKIIYNSIEFTQIKDFKDYYVSRCSKVLSTKKHNRTNIRILRYGIGNKYSDYKLIVLTKNKKPNTKKVHRLVAMAFIPNPENKPCVNHKDGNKLNNDIDNLEWCTHKENTRHACANNLIKRNYGKDHHMRRVINQYDLQGNFIKQWDCIKDACDYLIIKPSVIANCLSYMNKTSGGYIWRYS